MKIKRFHGNITILTLFILLSCALMGVLVALYMKNFIRYSDEITSYEKTSYLARAGTELGLAIVGSREVGLVYSIESGNNIKLNFDCPYPVDEGEECPVDPKFSLSIDGLGNSYQNCSEEGKKEIKPGLSAIIPLFKDPSNIGSVSQALIKPETTIPRDLTLITANGDGDWNYGIVWMENDNTLYIDKRQGNVSAAKKRNPDVNKMGRNAYYIAANPSTTDSHNICIQGGDIAQETVKIVSIGYYNNRQLGTETLTTKALPSFLQGDNYIY